MTFIDDYTRMCWVYLLKDKSQAIEFSIFYVWIQNEAIPHIVFLRIDNGREYTSNEFESYFRQHGIKHQTTVPYNPQHNGVTKRMNKTLLVIILEVIVIFFNIH